MIKKLIITVCLFSIMGSAFASHKQITIDNETTGDIDVMNFALFNVINFDGDLHIQENHTKTNVFDVELEPATLEMIISVTKSYYLISSITQTACIITAPQHNDNSPPLISVKPKPISAEYQCTIVNGNTVIVEDDDKIPGTP